MAGVHVFSSQEGAETIPRGGVFFARRRAIGQIFRQINKDDPRTHHDALEFPDGQIVLLTDLFEDQEATVLQLPAHPATAAEAAAQERVALVG